MNILDNSFFSQRCLFRCSKRADKSRTPTMYLVEPETCAYVLGVRCQLTLTLPLLTFVISLG